MLTAAAMLALQSAPSQPGVETEAVPDQAPITSLSQLPVEEATAPRCGVAFAIIEGTQEDGDARAKEWPDIKTSGGREFFVRAMAKLMEDRGLDQDAVVALVASEVELMSQDGYRRANDMMPACLLLKEAAGL